MLTKPEIKNYLQKILNNFGYEGKKFYNGFQDTGREYQDPTGTIPNFILKKAPPTPWSGNDTFFIIDNGKSILKEKIYYSHLTLLKMCKHYKFNFIIDIGSHKGTEQEFLNIWTKRLLQSK